VSLIINGFADCSCIADGVCSWKRNAVCGLSWKAASINRTRRWADGKTGTFDSVTAS